VPADFSEVTQLAAHLQGVNGRLGRSSAKILRQQAQQVKRTMQRNAPVRSGELRGSIAVTAVGDGRTGSMSALIEALAPHGRFVEFGTARMAPQPYAAPAAREAERTFPAAIEQAGLEAISGSDGFG
jgi:HK97 gp10 family phage protein